MFRNYRGDSLLHRLNPLTKLFVLLSLNVAALLTIDPILLLPLLFIVLWLFYTSGTSSAREYKRYHVGKIILVFFLMLVVFNGIFWAWETESTSDALFVIPAPGGGYPITPEGFYIGVGAGLRFLILVLSLIAVLSTTYPKELSDALEKLGIPRKISYILNISLRFIPNLENEFRRVVDARRARGDERWEKGGLIEKLSFLKDVFPTILVNAIIMSQRVGTVLEVRKIGNRPTHYRNYTFSKADVVVLIFFAAVLVIYAVIFLEGIGWAG